MPRRRRNARPPVPPVTDPDHPDHPDNRKRLATRKRVTRTRLTKRKRAILRECQERHRQRLDHYQSVKSQGPTLSQMFERRHELDHVPDVGQPVTAVAKKNFHKDPALRHQTQWKIGKKKHEYQ